MCTFGEVALKARCFLISKEVSEPREAWRQAAQALGCSQKMTEKSCPRSAFIGLCEEGLVKDVLPGIWLRKDTNKRYALRAVQALRSDPTWIKRPELSLWRAVSPQPKKYNDQIAVVFALWGNDLITQDPISEQNSIDPLPDWLNA